MRIKSLLMTSGLAISTALAPVMVTVPSQAMIIIQDTASVSSLIKDIVEFATNGLAGELARLLDAEPNPTTKALALAAAAKVLAEAGANDAATDIAYRAIDAAREPGVSVSTQQVVGVSVANVADKTGNTSLAAKIDSAGGAIEGAANAASTNLSDSDGNAGDAPADVNETQAASNAVANTVTLVSFTRNLFLGGVSNVTVEPVNENTTGAVVINTSTNPETGVEETTVSFAGGNSNNQGDNTTITVVIGDKSESVSPVR